MSRNHPLFVRSTKNKGFSHADEGCRSRLVAASVQ